MTKTLSDFKRDITVGKRIQCNGIEQAPMIENNTGDSSKFQYGSLQVIPMKEKIAGERLVTYKDTTGFYLNYEGETKRGSFCQWPKADNLFYDGTIFAITEKTRDGQVWQLRHYTIA